MKSELEELIESYEKEREDLEKEISLLVQESEFLHAHYHQKALYKVHRQLEILRDLHRPYSNHLIIEKRMLGSVQASVDLSSADEDSYMGIRLRSIQSKIADWEAAGLEPTFDSQEIDDAIFALKSGSCKSFSLQFKQDPQIALSFELKNEAIEIILIYDEKALRTYRYVFSKPGMFKSLKFEMIDDKWVYRYPIQQLKDALEIKEMLARLIYYVFQYDRLYDMAYLIYKSNDA
jgi:hypothetical protein